MKKRLISMFLALVMVLSMLPSAVAASGMTPCSVKDTVVDNNYQVRPLGSSTTERFDYSIPEDGATVLVFFSIGCWNSANFLNALSSSPWLSDERVNFVAVEATNNNNELIQSFMDAFLGNENLQYMDVYYGYSSLAWKYNFLFRSESVITFPLVIVIADDGDGPVLKYADLGLDSTDKLELSLEALLGTNTPPEDNATPVEVTIAGTKDYTEAFAVTELVNEHRQAAGLSPLTMNKTLTECAMQRAAEIALFYGSDHSRPDGTACTTVLNEIGYTEYTTCGENIAMGQWDAADVMNDWMNSPGHRSNILKSSYTQIGVGSFEINGVSCWVQIFGNSNTDHSTAENKGQVDAQVEIRALEERLNIQPLAEERVTLDVGETDYIPAIQNRNKGVGFGLADLVCTYTNATASGTVIANVRKNLTQGGYDITGRTPGTGTALFTVYEGQENPLTLTVQVEGEVPEVTIPSVPMFRMYDPNSGEHFYTGSEEERDGLVDVGWKYEGVGFNFPAAGAPVYRMYNPVTGDHLYTMDETEKADLLAQGWNYEGVAFNSAADTEVAQYRLWNPNVNYANGERGAWHFTSSAEESDYLISIGWQYQGVGWYSEWM